MNVPVANAPLATGAGSPRPGAGSFETITFPVTGMVCGSCVSRITRSLRRLEGVDRVRVDLGRAVATVRRDRAIAPDASLAAAVAEAGYEAHLDAAVEAPDADLRSPLARLFRR
ncbi:MAG TPA: heavy metal-associated domain-containing protein [Candidatus Acidoferrales bacterium]|nr:heavy metal-associated domain-containing protein [Candidatus Acidoferrales bacterium]